MLCSAVPTLKFQAKRRTVVTSLAGDSCGLLPLLHVLKIDPVVCVDAVDRLCSRLRTTGRLDGIL